MEHKSLFGKELDIYLSKDLKGTFKGLHSPISNSNSKGKGNSRSNKEGDCKGGKKKFIPPTLDEVKKYAAENPELTGIDPVDFWKGYNDGGWIDTQGKPVRNWKLKFRTRSNYGNQPGPTKLKELSPAMKRHFANIKELDEKGYEQVKKEQEARGT